MWFKLAAANFSAKNLGKMADISNSYSINYNISGFAKTTAPTSVEKGKTISEITLTLQENYEMTGTATLSYGATSLNATVSGSTYKWTNITPTGSVTITAKATWVGSGEEPDNGGTVGGTTTWYTGYDVLDSSVAKDASSASYGGFAYSNETMLTNLRNKPINVIKASISATGTFTVGVVDSTNTIVDSVQVTVSNTGVQVIELGKTLTANDGQRPFVQSPNDTAKFLYQITSTISGFPKGMDAYVGVKDIQSFPNYNMNIDFGYTGTTTTTPSDAWYTGYDVISCSDVSAPSFGGFAYSNETMLAKLRNKPVNAIQINIKQAGTFTVGIVDSSNSIIDSTTVTISATGIQTVKLNKTLTASDGQRFYVNAPTDTATFLYEITNTVSGFPTGMDAYVGVKTITNFSKYNMNINFGYQN